MEIDARLQSLFYIFFRVLIKGDLSPAMAYPGIFFGGGGGSTNSVENRG
jgi:hypothetical protein